MFIVGQQYINQIPDAAHMQRTDDGLPLSFNPAILQFDIQDPSQWEIAGARCHKWEFEKGNPGDMNNDLAVFRLADVILMKAEAQMMLSDITGAVLTINQKLPGFHCSRAGMPDFTPPK